MPTALIGALTLAIILGMALAVRLHQPTLRTVDTDLVQRATAATRDHAWLKWALLAWQWISAPVCVFVVALGICWRDWAARGARSERLWAVVTTLTGWVATTLLKVLVNRGRPVLADPITHANGYSFPSAHASGVAVAATVTVLVLWGAPTFAATGSGSSRRRLALLGAAAVVVLATDLDRVFLGVHYPSDVLAGTVFGVGFALSAAAGYAACRRSA